MIKTNDHLNRSYFGCDNKIKLIMKFYERKLIYYIILYTLKYK